MARNPSPAKTQRPKDFCTIEQAGWIAQRVSAKVLHEYHAYHESRRWHRRLRRFLADRMGRLMVALRISAPTGDA